MLCAVLAEAFECPPDILGGMVGPAFLASPDVVFFGATVDGETAAVAGSVRVGETVGIFAVATLPASRRRGAGGAALSAALAHHVAAGVSRFVLQASESGAPVYERLGFSAVADVSLWSVEAE